jgi:glyoxylase I family protein
VRTRCAHEKIRAFVRKASYNSAMNFALEHLGLPSRDPKALKDWYVNTFDAKVVFDNQQTPPMFLVKMPGGMMIEFYAGDGGMKESANNKLNGWRHVALRIDSIENGKAHLEKRGVKFTEEIKPAGGGGRVLFFQDPEGNLLHLVERSEDSPVQR